MKRKLFFVIALACCLVLAVGILAACNDGGGPGQSTSDEENPGIEIPGDNPGGDVPGTDDPSQGEDPASEFEFTLSSDQSYYILSGYTGVSAEAAIPSTYEGLPVASIDDYAFYNCSGLMSVTIPDSVTSIGASAFLGCTGLTSITIPDSVTSIGYDAFHYCNGLTSVTIGNSVTSIGWSAFSGCTSLTSVTIPDSVTSIGDHAFNGCSSLTSITIPFVGAAKDGTSNTHFGYIFGASDYWNNEYYVPASLKEVVITGGAGIDDYAFYNCKGLTSATIPKSVTSIGISAFQGCSSLESITIPFVGGSEAGTSNKHFGYIFGATSSNYHYNYVPASLREVIITGGTSIGYYAFESCSGLTSVVIGDGVTSIDSYAFGNCTGLTSLTIGNGVTAIGGLAFFGCTGLTSITIPDSVTLIGSYVFSGCTGLKSATIGSGVTHIGDRAFYGCSGLNSVTFENTTGWYLATQSWETSETALASDGISNSSTAATWLKSTYLYYYWKRNA